MANINTRTSIINSLCSFYQPKLTKYEDINTFLSFIDKDIDEMKTEVVSNCIETFDDELRQNLPSGWSIVRRDKRELTTLFGHISFRRTLFLDDFGRRRYLCDELLGIPRYVRFSCDAFLWLLHKVSKVSFGQAAKDFKDISGCSISKMTIWNMVQRQAKLIKEYGEINNKLHLSCESICAECDGLFIAMQTPKRRKESINRFFADQVRDKKSFELKCGCVYAGKITENNRCKRLNVDMVASVSSSKEFYSLLQKRIESEYDIDDLDTIYFGSDAGSWCKHQTLFADDNFCPDIVHSLDRFHLMKAIRAVFDEGKESDYLVSLAIRKKPERFLKCLDRMIPQMKGAAKRKKAKALRGYVANNIELIKQDFNLGTMEATNAYVWAKRMKHIRGAWSKRGADAMAALLARIYSHKDLIAYPLQAWFSKKETEIREKVIQKRSEQAANQHIVGHGYEMAQGHICLEKAPGCFLPCAFLHQKVR